MDFITNFGKLIFCGDHFDFYLNTHGCYCGDCEYCNDCELTCSIKLINGKVSDIKSDELFEDIIYDYFREVGSDWGENKYEMRKEYEKCFMAFEKHVIDNCRPSGSRTKPARN
jgi:hypothetical protein